MAEDNELKSMRVTSAGTARPARFFPFTKSSRYPLLKSILLISVLGLVIFIPALIVMTMRHVTPMPDSLTGLMDKVSKVALTDRNGVPLTVTYANEWNSSAYMPLHEIPALIQKIFVVSEDKRFYEHHGVDWKARCHALVQNIISFKAVRGASTISEQVVRMVHVRPRTLWSRWIEGFDARELEIKHSKGDILEFYLNQVPYAANRRGIVQAAHYYFNRSPDTLSIREMIALAVLVRAPSHYDLYRNPGAAEESIHRLARVLLDGGVLSNDQYTQAVSEPFDLEKPGLTIHAGHFASHIYKQLENLNQPNRNRTVRTTIDGALQTHVEGLVLETLESLKDKNVTNAACLVADYSTGDILAWVSLGTGETDTSGMHINGVLTPRQPGSSMKPFLYALALDNGWTAAHEIMDDSLTNPVGRGLHTYHNYSRSHYGWVTVRESLGNSLNIPAVKAIRFVGYGPYLDLLHRMGFDSLDRHPDFYGDGLALGCGEVTLYHMVEAYGTLANQGLGLHLNGLSGTPFRRPGRRIFSEEAASLIGNILSDAHARTLEFGQGGILNFPVQTAVKTGTSNDYRDAWALGYNHRYVAGVWMGNFDGRPTEGLTGSTGPALILRSVFAELNRHQDTRPLFLSPKLVQKDVCLRQGFDDIPRICRKEWFVKGTEPITESLTQNPMEPGFIKPVNGLELAMDPRIPDHLEAFEFSLQGVEDSEKVTWTLDGKSLGDTRGGRYLWTLQKGKHVVKADVYKKNQPDPSVDEVFFIVK